MTTTKAPDKSTRIFIELDTTDPIVVTLTDSSVFKTEKYLLGQNMLTARGAWAGEETTKTVMIPLTSIQSIDLLAKEVPEEEVTKAGHAVARKQEEAAG